MNPSYFLALLEGRRLMAQQFELPNQPRRRPEPGPRDGRRQRSARRPRLQRLRVAALAVVPR